MECSLFPCNTSDAYVPALEFAGESFQINPLDWNLGAVSDEDIEMLALGNQTLVDDVYATAGSIDDLCISGLIGADLTSIENLYVIGDVFIKNVSKIFSLRSLPPFGIQEGLKSCIGIHLRLWSSDYSVMSLDTINSQNADSRIVSGTP